MVSARVVTFLALLYFVGITTQNRFVLVEMADKSDQYLSQSLAGKETKNIEADLKESSDYADFDPEKPRSNRTARGGRRQRKTFYPLFHL